MKSEEDPFIQHLSNIHDTLMSMLKENRVDEAKEYMNTFGEHSDVNELKTVQIITQSHPLLKAEYARLREIFDRKMRLILMQL